MSAAGDQDLVIVSLPGVQRFIAEGRTTRDLAHSSSIVSELADLLVAGVVGCPDAELVLPGSQGGVVSNKIVFLAKRDEGAGLARAFSDQARRWWAGRVEEGLGGPAATPNFPIINWVCVGAEGRSYAEQWELATTSLAGRRRLRDFTAVHEPDGRRVCSVTGRWVALPDAPPDVPPHDRNESLSAVAWVKRRWSTGVVPSTSVIATAPYRAWIANHLAQDGIRQGVLGLSQCADKAIPRLREYPLPQELAPFPSPERSWISSAGQWVQEDTWTVSGVEDARLAGGPRSWADAAHSAETGRNLAKKLRDVVSDAGGPAPARYLALVAQDLDDMGKRLSGVITGRHATSTPRPIDPDWHRNLSRQLSEVGVIQRLSIESTDHLGKVIYAGGDDLLALVPASTALAAARAAYKDLAKGKDLPTASTAIFFFHQNANLSEAVRSVHELLAQAKASSVYKHALAVGFARRSGNVHRLVRPWQADPGHTAFVDLLETLRTAGTMSLTPSLLGQLRRDRAELESLATTSPKMFRAEVRRLIKRHVAAPPGDSEAPREGAIGMWTDAVIEVATQLGARQLDVVGAMRIGLFLRQECR